MQEATAETLPLPVPAAADVLTSVLRQGAQRMLAQAIEAEAPRVLVRGGQVEAPAVLGVDAPPDARIANPAVDRFQVGFREV